MYVRVHMYVSIRYVVFVPIFPFSLGMQIYVRVLLLLLNSFAIKSVLPPMCVSVSVREFIIFE